jgi:hypothetical protein
MKTCLFWKQLLMGCLLLALLTGCATATPQTPTPEPTAIPTRIPADTPSPTRTPLPFVEGTEFPTGRFVLDGSRFYAIEFDEDGTWRDYETDVDVPSGGGKYGTNGNLYSEMTHSYSMSPQVPATYYWTYDGKKLTFQLWGEDVNGYRKSLFDGQTYMKAETDTPAPARTPPPVVEGMEFPTGRFVHKGGRRAFEFTEDGTWAYFEGDMENHQISGKYVTNGDLHTEMTFRWPTGRQVPATYYWSFDGRNLTFHLWGKDLRPHRKSTRDGETYAKSD